MKSEQYLNKEFYLNYWQQNKAIIISSLLIAVISYGYELFNFTLSIDEETQSFKSASDTGVIIAVGRWGLFLLNWLLIPQSVLPYLPMLIALFCLSFISVVILNIEKNDFVSGLVFSIIFISNPIHSYYLAWNGAVFYTIGMVLTTFSYLSFITAIEEKKFSVKYYFFSIIFLGFSLAIYQALLAFFMVFATYYLFHSQANNKSLIFQNTLKAALRIIAVVGLAFLFYKVGDISARYFLFDGKYFNNTAYLENFILWGKMPIKEVLLKLIRNTGGYLLGMKNFGGVICLVSKSLILIIPIFLYFTFKGANSSGAKIFSVILFGILILSPFTVNFLNGTPLPTRTLMSLAMMTAILWLLVYRHAGAILRRIMVVAAFIILINNTHINTRLFYSSYVSWQADREMANRIIERVHSLDPHSKNDKIQIAFVGGYQHPSNELFVQSDVHGASFFGWDGGNPWRIRDFFRTIGVNELNIVQYENLGYLKEKIEAMPAWPAKGSVKLIDNIVIVKLSDPVNFSEAKQISKLTFHQEFSHLPDSMLNFNPVRSDVKTDYSIDIINDILINKVNQKIFNADENIIIKGWAIDKPSLKPASRVYLLINDRFYLTDFVKARPDVAKAYKNDEYKNVGWELKLPEGELKKGFYKMRVVIIGYGKNTYFYPDQIVEFEVR